MKGRNKLALSVAAIALAGVLTVGSPLGAMAEDGTVTNGSTTSTISQTCQQLGLRMGRTFGSMRDSIAQYLGMDTNELRTERQNGKSMVDIAGEKGKSEEELTNFVYSERKAQLDQLVKDGKITKEQAASQEAVMKERIKANLNRTSVGPNYGGQRGQGGQKGQGGQRGQGMGN